MKTLLTIIPFLSFAVVPAAAHTLKSPDGDAVITLTLQEGIPHWSVKYGSHAILGDSRIGLQRKGATKSFYKEESYKQATSDNTWKPVWDKVATIRDHYNEARWKLKPEQGSDGWTVVARAYDNGVAVRYEYGGTGKVTFTADLTEFRFAGDFTCWGANGERANIGPIPASKYRGGSMPLTLKVANDCYASLLEAGIFIFDDIKLQHRGKLALGASMSTSHVTLPSQSSWRVVLLGKKPGDLLVNHTMVNLNPPCAIKDTSWIKPGVTLWDWRAWGAKTEDGFTYALDMESWKRHIDFASKHKLGYLLLDAGWYGLEFDPNEDPTTSRDHLVLQPDPHKPHLVRKPAPKDWKNPVDVPALIKYANSKDVGIILYLNDAAQQKHDLDKTLATYQQWGAAGIKYGFMSTKGQKKVLKTRKIVEVCARHQLLCDFHDGPIAPSGDRRTFPNYITREYCHAQSDAMRTFTPRTFCTTVFVNMLSGPIDMTNGLYDLKESQQKRPKIFAEVYSTIAAETARTLITFSGLQVLPDTPEKYEQKSDIFDFIAKFPRKWQDTRILNGQIGHYITTARRSGKQWFIASCCDEKGAELPIKLDFLEPGVTYQATLYEDGADAHYKTNRESYKVRKITVKKGDTITAKLAPGGGHCIHLTP